MRVKGPVLVIVHVDFSPVIRIGRVGQGTAGRRGPVKRILITVLPNHKLDVEVGFLVGLLQQCNQEFLFNMLKLKELGMKAKLPYDIFERKNSQITYVGSQLIRDHMKVSFLCMRIRVILKNSEY